MDISDKNCEYIVSHIKRIQSSQPNPIPSHRKWALGFLESIRKQCERDSEPRDCMVSTALSPNQEYHLNKIFKEASSWPQEASSNLEFQENYKNNKDGISDDFKVVVEYCLATPYYASLKSDITKAKLDNTDYIPTERMYNRVMENKYVDRYLKEFKLERKYDVGQIVTLRSGSSLRGSTRRIEEETGRVHVDVYKEGSLLVVLSYSSDNPAPVKGGKKLLVLPLGSNEVFNVQERNIKKAKVKK